MFGGAQIHFELNKVERSDEAEHEPKVAFALWPRVIRVWKKTEAGLHEGRHVISHQTKNLRLSSVRK